MIARKKSLIMIACALMIISSVAFGTIAYLTDRAGVTNRFTVGNVEIKVDENVVDENGKDIPNDDNRTEEGNEYPFIPGGEYDKDPTMTVKGGSEEAYVRMIVTITKAKEIKSIFEDLAKMYPDRYADGFAPEQYVTGWSNDEWNFKGMEEDTESNTFTLEFWYPNAVDAADGDEVLPALFTEVKIPGDLTNKHLAMLKPVNAEDEGFKIDVYGQAIQTAGFENADAAWAAFDEQMTAVEKLENSTTDDDDAANGDTGNGTDDNTTGDNAGNTDADNGDTDGGDTDGGDTDGGDTDGGDTDGGAQNDGAQE